METLSICFFVKFLYLLAAENLSHFSFALLGALSALAVQSLQSKAD